MMPNIILIALKFIFLALLFLFLYEVMKLVYIDIFELSPPKKKIDYILKQHAEEPVEPTMVIVKGAGVVPNRVYPLGDVTTIGRLTENDIVLRDSQVSQKHARIFKRNEDYYIEDLQSTNGTFVGGKRIMEPALLKLGKEIRIGQSVLKFRK